MSQQGVRMALRQAGTQDPSFLHRQRHLTQHEAPLGSQIHTGTYQTPHWQQYTSLAQPEARLHPQCCCSASFWTMQAESRDSNMTFYE